MPYHNCQVGPTSPSAGFTLVELLTVVATLAVLVGLAMPTFGTLLAKWHRDSATRLLVSHLQLARLSAIKSSAKVVMCNSQDGVQCSQPAHFDWSSGWLIFRDSNPNNALDPTDELIASAGPVPGILSLASSNRVRRFVFLPNGLMSAGMSSMVITPSSGDAVKVVINRTGRFRLATIPQANTQ
jgi:type IV fimbrial biogenesis protein FimT